MSDASRTATVAVSAVIALVGGFIGSGVVVGTPIADAAGGALAADATLVAPAGPAFAIWSVIYVGLLALAVYQYTPDQRGDARQRRVGWWVAASLLLNAAWILVVQAGSVVGSFLVITGLLVVLLVTVVRLIDSRPTSRLQALLLDAVMGFYLGWVAIATVANAAAALTSSAGWSPVGTVATVWAIALLVIAVLASVALSLRSGGQLSPALSLAWGLGWVVSARASGDPRSVAVVVVAAVGAVVVLAAPAVVRLRGTVDS